jgi:F-type H+-transporting ATPase subunit b
MISMKRCHIQTGISILVALLIFFSWAAVAVAAENNGGWRSTYDLIMRWVNFAILVFVIVKFARRPLQKFLSGKGEEISLEIRNLEDEKNQLVERVRQAEKELDDSSGRITELKQRIVHMGERRKQEIIAEAHQEAKIIIKNAKRKNEGLLAQAKNTLRSEMIDAAADLVLDRLPGIITVEDNKKLLQQYMARAATD